MPELRRDPVVGYWTIIANERGWRPMEYRPNKITDERECPFCEGRESGTPREVFALRGPASRPDAPGWEVRVIVSKAPLLSDEHSNGDSHGQGIYDWREGVGRHEVIVETPQHRQDLDELSLTAIQKVLQVYVSRMREMEKEPRFAYALLFKNHGLVSGSAQDVIRHSRSQMIGMPIVPKRAKEELAAAKTYFQRRERCVYCDVLKQESSEGSRLVFQNDAFFAFCPFAARSPFEIWILPKKHCADFWKVEEAALPQLAAVLKSCLSKLRVLLDDPPYNLVLHTAPFRHRAKGGYWKTIDDDTHWYLQIIPRLTLNAGFEWGTGIHINPTPPEEAASLLRDTEVSG